MDEPASTPLGRCVFFALYGGLKQSSREKLYLLGLLWRVLPVSHAVLAVDATALHLAEFWCLWWHPLLMLEWFIFMPSGALVHCVAPWVALGACVGTVCCVVFPDRSPIGAWVDVAIRSCRDLVARRDKLLSRRTALSRQACRGALSYHDNLVVATRFPGATRLSRLPFPDSLSQEFVAGWLWWRFVAPCIASNVSCGGVTFGVPGGGPGGRVVTVVSELRGPTRFVAFFPAGFECELQESVVVVLVEVRFPQNRVVLVSGCYGVALWVEVSVVWLVAVVLPSRLRCIAWLLCVLVQFSRTVGCCPGEVRSQDCSGLGSTGCCATSGLRYAAVVLVVAFWWVFPERCLGGSSGERLLVPRVEVLPKLLCVCFGRHCSLSMEMSCRHYQWDFVCPQGREVGFVSRALWALPDGSCSGWWCFHMAFGAMSRTVATFVAKDSVPCVRVRRHRVFFCSPIGAVSFPMRLADVLIVVCPGRTTRMIWVRSSGVDGHCLARLGFSTCVFSAWFWVTIKKLSFGLTVVVVSSWDLYLVVGDKCFLIGSVRAAPVELSTSDYVLCAGWWALCELSGVCIPAICLPADVTTAEWVATSEEASPQSDATLSQLGWPPGGIQGVAPFGCKGRPGSIQGVVPFVCEGRPAELGVFSFAQCSALEGLFARQVVTITWDPYPRAPVSEGVALGGGRAQVVDALFRCGQASPSQCLALRCLRSRVGRSGVGPQLGQAAVVCGCVLSCGSLASLYRGGCRWESAAGVLETVLLMWLLGVSRDDTWLFLPNLVEVWDVGACVVRLWSHLVAPVFLASACVDSAGSAGVVFGLTKLVRDWLSLLSLVREAHPPTLFRFSDPWVVARPSGSLAGVRE
ncbi:hypothetical protein Taro_051738, partial [Colocasia esculenta]|nr:hypothetical protein [Colocasia esculenta]